MKVGVKKRELRAMPEDELRKRISELRKDLMKLKTQSAMKTSVESPGRIKAGRRGIAKILTILKEKKKKREGGEEERGKEKKKEKRKVK